MTRVKECVLYRGFEHGEILDKMTALMDACEKSAVNAKEMEEDFYECVNGLIETAGSYGFAGNLWHNYLTHMDVLVRRMLQQGAYAVPVEQQAAVKGQHKNKLILRYSGLTRDELALGAAQLKARRSRPIGRWMHGKKEAPTAAIQQ